MNLLERIFAEPELRAEPPVLVDVGAAGGAHAAWRRIARFATGVGFEPDARETAALDGARKVFRNWSFVPAIAAAERPADGKAELHLTRSPQCSSTLRPRAEALGEWAFAEFFEVTETRVVAATTLVEALERRGLGRIDWLKCDTQGLDWKLWRSLPAAWRARVLAVEFEPGLIDAYEGEDKLADVLAGMAREPFWLAGLDVGRTPRGRVAEVERSAGRAAARWLRRLGPAAPAWANARFLRDVTRADEPADRRAHLLAWVLAGEAGQHGWALRVAAAGAARWGGGIFAEMEAASARALRWAMVRNLPAALWRRIGRAR